MTTNNKHNTALLLNKFIMVNLRTWADMYDECDMETNKMISSRIMQSVKVSRDYEIDVDFTLDFEQIGVRLI